MRSVSGVGFDNDLSLPEQSETETSSMAISPCQEVPRIPSKEIYQKLKKNNSTKFELYHFTE